MAAQKLLGLASDIYIEDKPPVFLMVITKGSLAYQREDGVHVVPLACLKN
jgi:hypothetical protein